MWKYLEKVWFQVDQNIDTEESKKKKNGLKREE